MIHSERGIDWMLRYQLGCSGTSWDAPTPAGMLRHQLGCSGTNYEKKIRSAAQMRVKIICYWGWLIHHFIQN